MGDYDFLFFIEATVLQKEEPALKRVCVHGADSIEDAMETLRAKYTRIEWSVIKVIWRPHTMVGIDEWIEGALVSPQSHL